MGKTDQATSSTHECCPIKEARVSKLHRLLLLYSSKIKACIARRPLDEPPKFEIRTFSTMIQDLLKLKDWLIKNEVEAVAMKCTGVYWMPIFNILEDSFDIVLANPQYLKKVLGNMAYGRLKKKVHQLIESLN